MNLTAHGPEWHHEGIVKVAPGVHRIPLPLPDAGLRAVNCYVLEEGDGVVLVDPGQVGGRAREILEAGLRAVQVGFDDVRQILVTHVHRDHYTNAVALRREFGTPIALGAGERASIASVRDSERSGMDFHLDGLLALGAGGLAAEIDVRDDAWNLMKDIWEEPDRWLDDGDVLRFDRHTLTVRHTPGHTTGHVTYHDLDNRILFAGDHVLPTITPSIGFEPVPGPWPLADFLRSLAGTISDPDAMLAAAHGPVSDSARGRALELVEHHERRLSEVSAALVDSCTAQQVASQLRWTRRDRPLNELDPLNRMLAIFETKAHLDVLVRRGAAFRDLADGLVRYEPRVVAGAAP
jgi:glyoxylase-like metal-dependent hydrolase (beta-lactamase superfamily II)